jgi:hypothetical protein
MQEIESAAAQARAAWLDDRERRAHGDRSVERIAAGRKNFESRLAGERIGARDCCDRRSRCSAPTAIRAATNSSSAAIRRQWRVTP